MDKSDYDIPIWPKNGLNVDVIIRKVIHLIIVIQIL